MKIGTAAIAAILLTMAGGCAQMQEDALSLIPKPPVTATIPLTNTADVSPPILQPGCYAIPDRSWDTEGLSESEPWAPKCKAGAVWPGHEAAATDGVRASRVHHPKRVERTVRTK